MSALVINADGGDIGAASVPFVVVSSVPLACASSLQCDTLAMTLLRLPEPQSLKGRRFLDTGPVL